MANFLLKIHFHCKLVFTGQGRAGTTLPSWCYSLMRSWKNQRKTTFWDLGVQGRSLFIREPDLFPGSARAINLARDMDWRSSVSSVIQKFCPELKRLSKCQNFLIQPCFPLLHFTSLRATIGLSQLVKYIFGRPQFETHLLIRHCPYKQLWLLLRPGWPHANLKISFIWGRLFGLEWNNSPWWVFKDPKT